MGSASYYDAGMRLLPWCILLLSACPPSLRRPESPQLVVTGTLTAGGFAKRGEPVESATVTLRRASDGAELAANTSSSAGGYRLTATVEAGARVVLVAEHAAFAPIARAFTVGPYTELTVSAALTPREALECVDAFCAAPGVDLEWSEPPQGATGAAATFEQEPPLLVEVDATRPALLSLGWAQLTGASGTLRLRVPLSSWAGLVDAQPGNGTLEVPTATFDPKTAKWTRGTAPLTSEAGFSLPESALPGLRSGDFAGGAVAEFPVTSDVFFAVLGGPSVTGCVTGTLEAEGRPAQGATFAFAGFEPVTAAADGTFCARARVGDDPAPVSGQYAGLPYSLGAKPRAKAEGACGGTCTTIGDVTVLADALQIAALCKVTGKVVDSAGAPVANAEVVALDESVTSNATTAFCGKTGTRCSLAAPSGADGSFTLNAPLLTTLLVGARTEGQRTAKATFASCPTAPITLVINHGAVRLEVTAAFSGTQLTWLPALPAARLAVLDGAGLAKWELTSAAGLTSPLTYGVVPSGATQTVAMTGALATGDTLVVELEGVGRDGLVFSGTGTATR